MSALDKALDEYEFITMEIMEHPARIELAALRAINKKMLDLIKAVYKFRCEDGSLPFNTLDYVGMEEIIEEAE